MLAAQGGNTPPEDARLEALWPPNAPPRPAAQRQELAANPRHGTSELEEEIAAAEQAQAAAASGIAQTESTIAEVQDQAESLELALDKLRAGHRSWRSGSRR